MNDPWLKIWLLGQVSIERRAADGSWVAVHIRSRNALALLAILACAPDGADVGRDDAAAAITGDATRHYVNHPTYEWTRGLRKDIDDGRDHNKGVVGGSDRSKNMRLGRETGIYVDYDEFRELRAKGDHEAALDLVRGELALNAAAVLTEQREQYLKEINNSRAALNLPRVDSVEDALVDRPRSTRRPSRVETSGPGVSETAAAQLTDDERGLITMGRLLKSAGIRHVHPDREGSAHPDNAQKRLAEWFRHQERGEILMMGVSLRVFFSDQGEFFRDIEESLLASQGGLRIRAITSAPGSPQAKARSRIEQPHRKRGARRKIDLNIEFTREVVQGLVDEQGVDVTLRHTDNAPYCTAVIFDDGAFFSPNILAPKVPVGLPMVEFEPSSHGYQMLNVSFEHIWREAIPIIPADSPVRAAIDRRLRELIKQLRPASKVTPDQLLHPLFREFQRPAEVHAALMQLRKEGLVAWDDDDDEPGWIDGPDVEIRLLGG